MAVRQQRIALLYLLVVGRVVVRHQRTQPQTAFPCFFYGLKSDAGDVDQMLWGHHIDLHQVEQIGAARYKFGFLMCRHFTHRALHIRGPGIAKRSHRASLLSSASCTTFTMFTYAPQRHTFPLIRSRISSIVLALPSFTSPITEQICPGVQ
jgi:hypothetical protein